MRHTGIGCLKYVVVSAWRAKKNNEGTHFFASKNFLPNNPGSKGTTRSSAKNKPFSCRRSLRASNGLNFPFNFVMPTTRLINLMPCESSKSLYSRCGSFVIKQTEDVRGSTRGCFKGLYDEVTTP